MTDVAKIYYFSELHKQKNKLTFHIFKTEKFSLAPPLHLTYTYSIPTLYLPPTQAKSIKYYKNKYPQKNILQNTDLLENKENKK